LNLLVENKNTPGVFDCSLFSKAYLALTAVKSNKPLDSMII